MSTFEELHRLRLTIKQSNESLRKLAETQRLHGEALRELFDGRMHGAIKSIESSQRIVEALRESADIQRKFSENCRAHIAQSIEMHKRVDKTLTHITKPYIPELQRINSFAKIVARQVEPHKGVFSSIPAWESSLIARMETLKTRWVLPNFFDKPMAGFARLSRLSDAVHTAEPYSMPVAELVADELGDAVGSRPGQSEDERDAAAMDAGLNPELIAFPPAAYGDVILAAGFSFRVPAMAVPQAVESGDLGTVFDPRHWQMLAELEQRLRHVVEETLAKLAGPNWIERRVCQTVRQRWEKRQEEDRIAGRPTYAPIHYADFMDLADIIGRKDNWDGAFKPIFQNREDFMVSLRRLRPVRNAIAHSRPLGRSDVLYLFAEATRIFRALGIQILD